jgi:hypothetical protein
VPEEGTPQEVGGVGDGGRWCHGDVDRRGLAAGWGRDAGSRTTQPLMEQGPAENGR